MKTHLLLLLAVLAACPLFADDTSQVSPDELLQNSNFADGTTLWHGDCKPAGSDASTDFITNKSSAQGLLVELRHAHWTKITQELRDKAAPANVVLTITYQTSSDFKPSDKQPNSGGVGPDTGFPGANVPVRPGQIAAFFDVPPLSRASVSDNGSVMNVTVFSDAVGYNTFTPSTNSSPQTVTLQIRVPSPTKESHQTLCLAFPPGDGSITITKISAVPGQDQSDRQLPLQHYRPPGFPTTPNPGQ